MDSTITFKEYIDKIKVNGNSVVTIGNFDGLHLGHMTLIDKTIEIAEKNDLLSIVFSYDVHPQNVLYKKLVHIIMPSEEKEKILSDKGIFMVLQAPFDKTLQTQSAFEFCDNILIKKLKAKFLVMGEDAKFGIEMMTADKIKEYLEQKGVKVELIPLLKIDGVRISSSEIRKLIENGEIEKANEYLGREFDIIGKVVHGKKLGKNLLGFPTANMELVDDQVVPPNGVYSTLVEFGGKTYKGATSVGNNPTFGENALSVETHILDFDKIIYGKSIKVKFLKKIRDEITFSGKD